MIDLAALIADPAETLRELDRFETENRLKLVYPEEGPLRRELYVKHMEFYAATKVHNEVAFIASNRSGKSFSLCYAVACHLTGFYQPWWPGRRWDRPVSVWLAGDDAKAVRESIQLLLFGPMGEFGTGLIPKDRLKRTTMRQGIADSVDTAEVLHSTGGTSRIALKAYEQSRLSFQGAGIDIMGFDEEPPLAIYTEGLTRTMSTVPGAPNGLVLGAFTPLRGISDTVLLFLPGGVVPATEELRRKAWGWTILLGMVITGHLFGLLGC